MYKTILLTLDTTPSDRTIIEHIKPLAKLHGSRIVLLHVADGWAARTFGSDAVSPEVDSDKAYLEKVRTELRGAGIEADAELAFGDPVEQIVNWAKKNACDLVAMSTHGHKLLGDLIHGTTASRVQHSIHIPVLLIRAKQQCE
jgi:nucleotide-binding universal stress UspA family protein